MKCAGCGAEFRFLDGFVTAKGMVCPKCHAAESAGGKHPAGVLEAMGLRVKLAARVDKALAEFLDDDTAKGEATLGEAIQSGDEKGTPDRQAALWWRALVAVAKFEGAVALLEAAKAAEAAAPEAERGSFGAAADLGALGRAVESTGLWIPVTVTDLLHEDDPPLDVVLSLPAAPAKVEAWRAWRPYDRSRMRAEAGKITSMLGWEDAAFGKWARDETAEARAVFTRLSLVRAFGGATGQGDSPADWARPLDRPAGRRVLDAALAAAFDRLGAAAARSAGVFADARRRLAQGP